MKTFSARIGIVCLALAAPATLLSLGAPAAAQPDDDEGLGDLIDQRLRADGPFFTPEERAVIDQACGYAPGEWDGFSMNTNDGELRCANGRRADSPQVRRVLRAAEPRIEARVERVMESAEVRNAIGRITERATSRAMREIEREMRRRGL
jgi:hypothetical protein